MIDLKNVCFGYDNFNTIKDVSFHINKGEFVAIAGSNGAGKTTLSKLIAGLLKPVNGDVVIDGLNTKTAKHTLIAKKLGFLFQNPDRQICKNTVYDELIFGLECVSDYKEYNKKRVEEVIEEFGFDRNANPFNLSRGERQRIALASLIAVNPDILILDEPTTGLDYNECMQIMSAVKKLNENGITVVMVCHDMELVYDFAKRIIVVADGEKVADGDTVEIFRNKEILKKASLLPPQIISLSLLLGNEFDTINNVTEMADFITERVKNK